MERKEIYDLLLETLELKDSDINEDTDLESINFDSMARLVAISVIDETFNKVIPAKSLYECNKIGDIIDLIIKE